jgi:hypothetical protein
VICAVASVVVVMLMLVESEALELKSVGLQYVVSSKLLCTVSGEIMDSLVFRVGCCPYLEVFAGMLGHVTAQCNIVYTLSVYFE